MNQSDGLQQLGTRWANVVYRAGDGGWRAGVVGVRDQAGRLKSPANRRKKVSKAIKKTSRSIEKKKPGDKKTSLAMRNRQDDKNTSRAIKSPKKATLSMDTVRPT